MDDQEITDRLISIGHAIETNGDISDDLINSLKPYGRVNLSVWLTLDRIGKLTKQELIELLKGMVLLEKRCNWSGGSVASTKYLQPILLSRGLDKNKALEVFSWVILNTNSIYVSCMARDILRAKTYSGYLSLCARKDAQAEAKYKHLA